MFERSYPFTQLSISLKPNEYPLIGIRDYSFKTLKARRYLVQIHEYDHKVFVIKFCDARFKKSAVRYTMVLNDYDFSRILRTVINITETVFREEPNSSFAFYGVHKKGEETKDTSRTQRFRIYKKITEDLFGGQTFLHSYEESVNCYLLINKSNGDPIEKHATILDMFAREFTELGHLLD